MMIVFGFFISLLDLFPFMMDHVFDYNVVAWFMVLDVGLMHFGIFLGLFMMLEINSCSLLGSLMIIWI